MSARTAILTVADDLLTSIGGKQTLQGIYVGDISIPTTPAVITQMVFYFIIECSVDDIFKSITLEITFPGEAPKQIPVSFATPIIPAGRSKHIIRATAMIQFPILRPGRIDAKVIHEKGEIIVAAPWITQISAQGNSPA